MSEDPEFAGHTITDANAQKLIAVTVGAVAGLIGLLASDRRMADWDTYIQDAWRCGELMAEEFGKRWVAMVEKPKDPDLPF